MKWAQVKRLINRLIFKPFLLFPWQIQGHAAKIKEIRHEF